MFRDMYDFDSVVAELKNQFQNEPADWYAKSASLLIMEGSKDGDSVPNLIDKLFR